MPMLLTFAAMSAEAAAAAAAAGTALTAAAPIAATTAATTAAAAAAPTLTAAAVPGIVGGASPVLSAAAPVAEGITAGAQAMSPEIAANIGQAAAQNAGQAVNPAIQGGANPAFTQASPPPTVPQGIDQGLNVQSGVDPSITNNIPNGGFDAYGQFTQAPGTIDPATANQAAAPKPYVNGPPSGGIGSPIDPNAGLLEGVDYAKMTGVDVPHAGQATSSGLQKGFESAMKFAKDNPLATMAIGQGVTSLLSSNSNSGAPPKKAGARRDMSGFQASEPSTIGYTPIFQPTPYAEGGIAYAIGGTVEQMSAQNALGANQTYPQSQLQTSMYASPMMQRPVQNNVINSGIDTPVDAYSGETRYAAGGVTGNGNLNLNIPLDLGGSGIAGGNGYVGGVGANQSNGQAATLSTATGEPSQTAQPPVATAPAATAEPLDLAPRGRSYVPNVTWSQKPTMMGGGGGLGGYTTNDQAADEWVKNKAGARRPEVRDAEYKAQIEGLYNQYYRGYAKGGTTTSTDASKRYAQMMGAQSAEQQRANEEYLDAYAKREMGKSINTDSDVDTRTKDPLNASLTSLKKIGKRVGIKPVDLPKSNVTDSNVFHAAANGGIMHSLGGYSDGGRLLKGPGDGVSDSIPATIGNRQPARLADGEFVVPARIVSELGNGSTEAGARKLYQMMERVQADRKKSIGKGKVAVNSKATKHLPK